MNYLIKLMKANKMQLNEELYLKLLDLWNSRNTTNWRDKIMKVSVQQELQQFKDKYPTMTGNDSYRISAWFIWIISKIYGYQLRTNLGLTRKLSNQEQAEIKKMQRIAKREQKLVKLKLLKLRFQASYSDLDLTNLTIPSSNSSNLMHTNSFVDFSILMPHVKHYDLNQVMSKIRVLRPKTLSQAIIELKEYDWLDVFQAILGLAQLRVLSVQQEFMESDPTLLYITNQ